MNIKESKEYLKNYKYDNEVYEAIQVVFNELNKKDKQIRLMAERIEYDTGWFYSDLDNYKVEEIIEYFYNKAQEN